MPLTASGRVSLLVNNKPSQSSAVRIKLTRDQANLVTMEVAIKINWMVVVALLEQMRKREEGYVIFQGL